MKSKFVNILIISHSLLSFRAFYFENVFKLFFSDLPITITRQREIELIEDDNFRSSNFISSAGGAGGRIKNEVLMFTSYILLIY